MAKQVSKYESDAATPLGASVDLGEVHDGASTTADRTWYKNTSTASEVLALARFRIAAVSGNDGDDYFQIAADVPLSAPGACSAAKFTSAGLEIGHYHYAITFVVDNGVDGETVAGTEAEVDTTSGDQGVHLTAIPIGPATTKWRRIYRTAVGGSTLKLVTTLANNTATTYTDTTPDASLGVTPPALNTSGSAGTWGTSNVNIGNMAVGDFAAYWYRYNVPGGTVELGNPRLCDVVFEETA